MPLFQMIFKISYLDMGTSGGDSKRWIHFSLFGDVKEREDHPYGFPVYFCVGQILNKIWCLQTSCVLTLLKV